MKVVRKSLHLILYLGHNLLQAFEAYLIAISRLLVALHQSTHWHAIVEILRIFEANKISEEN